MQKYDNILNNLKIVLLNETYTVLLSEKACHTYIDSCNLSERRINGFIDHPTKTIVINSDIDVIQQLKTLIHELTHGIIHQNGLNYIFSTQINEEDTCDAMGEGIISLFQNNIPLMQKIIDILQENRS